MYREGHRVWGMEIEHMVGQVFTSVTVCGDSIYFENDEYRFILEHQQDCCEHVYIESIVGDVSDLNSEPILIAERRCNDDSPAPYDYTPESYTWTFFTFATRKGYVDVRFFGTSNGYYGESADIVVYKKKGKSK